MSYAVEQWTEYGIGMSFFFLRFFARLKVVGRRNLAWDDLFSFFAMIFFTFDAAAIQVINNNGSFVGLNEQSAAALSDAEAARLEVGSKTLFVGWITYVSLIWSLKASLLCFYSRLTLGLWQTKSVKIMAAASLIAYVAVILTLFGHCTPTQKNWQIKPYAGDQCTVTVMNYIVVAALNVLTDAAILSIPISLVWKVKIPLRRKLVISLLICSGVFVIIAALLRCILTLADAKQIGNSTIWASRETFVSIIAVSAPAIKPLFNQNRWIGSSHDKGGSSNPGGYFKKSGGNGTALETENSSKSVARDIENDLEAQESWNGTKSAESDPELRDISRYGFEEEIVEKNQYETLPLKINVTTVYALVDDERAQSSKDGGDEEDEDERKIMGRTGNLSRGGETTTYIVGGKSSDDVRGASKASRILGTD